MFSKPITLDTPGKSCLFFSMPNVARKGSYNAFSIHLFPVSFLQGVCKTPKT